MNPFKYLSRILLLALLALALKSEVAAEIVDPSGDQTATLLKNGQVLLAGGFRVGPALDQAILFDPWRATFTQTGSMSTVRTFHSAVLLRNGRVLVAGGVDNWLSQHGMTSAEIYDPLSGTWSATDPMSVGRYSFTLTLLNDGKVLAAGGGKDILGDPMNSSEIYDPATGHWSMAGPMISSRTAHTATLLPDGRILAAGGFPDRQSAELFDPVSKTWSTTASMEGIHTDHHATLLSNSRVLLSASGNAFGEIYDPASASWSRTGPLTQSFSQGSATLLNNGKVLNTGESLGTRVAQLYDPGSNTWAATGSLVRIRTAMHTATRLSDGRVLAFAGGSQNARADAEIYDPATGLWSSPTPRPLPAPTNLSAILLGRSVFLSWTETTGATLYRIYGSTTSGVTPQNATMKPTSVRYGLTVQGLTSGETYHFVVTAANAELESAPSTPVSVTIAADGIIDPSGEQTATLLNNGQVLLAGGIYVAFPLDQALLFDPSRAAFTLTGSMSTARNYHSAVLLPNGRVLVAGGADGLTFAQGMSSAELYDPLTGQWSATDSMSVGRHSFTMTLLNDGKVLAAGGEDDRGDDINSSEMYDPATGHWSRVEPMISSRSYHTATLLPDGRVLMAGGVPDTRSAEIFNPVSQTWSATGSVEEIHYGHDATLLSNGRVLLSASGNAFDEIYDPASATWSRTGPVIGSFWNGSATLLRNGKVLKTGHSLGTRVAQLYDPTTNTWTATGSLAHIRTAMHTATRLQDGRVLAFAGGSRNARADAEIYDPETGRWSSPTPTPGSLPTPGLTLPATVAVTESLRGSYPAGTSAVQFNWIVTPVSIPGSPKTSSTATPELPLAPFTLAPGLYSISLQAADSAGNVSGTVQAQTTLALPVLVLDLPAVLPANAQVTATPPSNANLIHFDWSFERLGDQAPAPAPSRAPARVPGAQFSTSDRSIDLGAYPLDLGYYTAIVVGSDSYGNHSTPAQASFTLVAGDSGNVKVRPSPWRSDLHSGHPITFDDLPADSTLKIFSLDGRWVKTFAHAGGAVPWDLKNDNGSDVASGLYFYLVTSPSGKSKGKFAVIR